MGGYSRLEGPSTDRAYPNMIEEVRFAPDSALEGAGFEPSVPRVMDDDLGRQISALIAVFELAGTAVALQRGTKVVWPHRHPEFP
jgi:hypothetical protein